MFAVPQGGPDPPDCTIKVSGYEGWLNSTDIDDGYINQTVVMNRPIDCMWIINITEGWKVRIPTIFPLSTG